MEVGGGARMTRRIVPGVGGPPAAFRACNVAPAPDSVLPEPRTRMQILGVPMTVRFLPAPCRRLIGLFLVLALGGSAALETQGHGCQSRTAGVTGALEHAHHGAHGAPEVPTPGLPAECDCVGHACCSAPPSLPSEGIVAVVVMAPTHGAPVPVRQAGTLPAPPDHRLPFPLGPPAPLG